MWYHFGIIKTAFLSPNISLLSHISVTVILTVAAIIDIRERRIPDRLILVGTFIGLNFSLFNPDRGMLNSLIGGVTAGFILLLVYFVTKGALGLGDVKLFGCTGIYLGLEDIASAMLIAAVLSGLYSLMLVCINRDNKKCEIPFAPFILVGTLMAIIL